MYSTSIPSRQSSPHVTGSPTETPSSVVSEDRLQATLDALAVRAARRATVPAPPAIAPAPPAIAPAQPAAVPTPPPIAPMQAAGAPKSAAGTAAPVPLTPDALRSLVPPNMKAIQAKERIAPKGAAAAVAVVVAGGVLAGVSVGLALPFFLLAGLFGGAAIATRYQPVLPAEPLSLRLHAFKKCRVVSTRVASEALVHQLKDLGLLSHGRCRYLIKNPIGANLTSLHVNGRSLDERQRNLVAAVLGYMRDEQVAARRAIQASEALETEKEREELDALRERVIAMDAYLAEQGLHVSIADLEDRVSNAPTRGPAREI